MYPLNYFFFFGFAGSLSLQRLFPRCSEQRLLSSCRLLAAVAPLVMEHGSRARGLRYLQLPGSRAQTQYLWRTGLVDFPGGSDGKTSACNSGDPGSIPGSGRSSGEGNGNPLQCSCLENPRGGGAWWAAVYGVAQSRTRLK